MVARVPLGGKGQAPQGAGAEAFKGKQIVCRAWRASSPGPDCVHHAHDWSAPPRSVPPNAPSGRGKNAPPLQTPGTPSFSSISSARS